MVVSRALLSGDIIAYPLAWFELFQAFRAHPGAPGAAMLRCSGRASLMSVMLKTAILQWAEEVADKIIAWQERTGLRMALYTWLTIPQ